MATTTNNLNQSMDDLSKIFDQFDANKDDKISLPELGSVLESMGSSQPEPKLRHMMEEIDTDQDGFISVEEFASIFRSLSPSPTSELKEAFDLYDQNIIPDSVTVKIMSGNLNNMNEYGLGKEDKNGLISSLELHLVLTRLGMTCSVDDCVKMITSLDSDGDGNVNFEEFQKMMSANLPSGSRSV